MPKKAGLEYEAQQPAFLRRLRAGQSELDQLAKTLRKVMGGVQSEVLGWRIGMSIWWSEGKVNSRKAGQVPPQPIMSFQPQARTTRHGP